MRVSVIEDQLGRHVEYDSNTVHCCKYLQQLPYSIKSNDAGLRRLFPQMCRRNGSLGMVRQRKCRPVATAARLGSESDRPLWPTCTLSLSGRFWNEAAVAGKRRVTAARWISQIGAGGVIAVLVREHPVQRENLFAASCTCRSKRESALGLRVKPRGQRSAERPHLRNAYIRVFLRVYSSPTPIAVGRRAYLPHAYPDSYRCMCRLFCRRAR